MKNCRVPLLFVLAAASTAAVAAERSIVVPAKVTASWGYLTQSTVVKPSRTMGVGFWQRGSGAKPGFGEHFVSAMEFQLPEAAPSRVRRATFQFSGKPSQCIGAEPVVVNVHAYAADGRADIGDATAGPKVAQMRADCTDHAAFSQPIDVTHVVREASVASGVRFVGFNVRTANNRQGPGLFALAPGTLTVVLADEHVDAYPAARAGTPSHIDPHAAQAKTWRSGSSGESEMSTSGARQVSPVGAHTQTDWHGQDWTVRAATGGVSIASIVSRSVGRERARKINLPAG